MLLNRPVAVLFCLVVVLVCSSRSTPVGIAPQNLLPCVVLVHDTLLHPERPIATNNSWFETLLYWSVVLGPTDSAYHSVFRVAIKILP